MEKATVDSVYIALIADPKQPNLEDLAYIDEHGEAEKEEKEEEEEEEEEGEKEDGKTDEEESDRNPKGLCPLSFPQQQKN
jgi:hypothetical protein